MPLLFEDSLRNLALRSQYFALPIMIALQFGPFFMGLLIAVPNLWSVLVSSNWLISLLVLAISVPVLVALCWVGMLYVMAVFDQSYYNGLGVEAAKERSQ